MLEFDPGVSGAEVPFGFVTSIITIGLPGRGFASHGIDVRYATIEALGLQYTQLNLGDIEPTSMLGGVVNLQAFG